MPSVRAHGGDSAVVLAESEGGVESCAIFLEFGQQVLFALPPKAEPHGTVRPGRFSLINEGPGQAPHLGALDL